jgi:hypothetical protein
MLRALAVFAVTLVAGAACWSCSNSSAGAPDASEAGDDGGTHVAVDGPECDPCHQYCSCTPGKTMYSPTSCTTYTCPPTGVWGLLNCAGESCPDAANEEAASEPADATTHDAPAGDAPTDSPVDAPREAMTDGPGEAASD